MLVSDANSAGSIVYLRVDRRTALAEVDTKLTSRIGFRNVTTPCRHFRSVTPRVQDNF